MMTSEAERDTSCDQDIGSPRQVIATSALLKEFPWNSGVVFHQEPWLGFFQESPWVQKFLSRMHEFESQDLCQGRHAVFRRELRLGQDVSYHIAEQSKSPSNKPLFHSTKHTLALTTMLLNYRVLDIAGWIQILDNGSSFRLSVEQRRGILPLQQLSQVGYSALETDWKSALLIGMNSIQKSWDALFPTGNLQICDGGPNQDVAIQLFCSANHRLVSIRAFKIIQNLEVAAFHLAYLLKGHLDLPETYDDLKRELRCLQGGSDASLDTVDLQMKSLRSLGLPLQIALAISPLYWLLDINLVRRELDRGALLKSWAGLGGQKPRLLARVEYHLWKVLFEVATGAGSLQSSLHSALDSINSLDWESIRKEDICWFANGNPAGNIPNKTGDQSSSPDGQPGIFHSGTTHSSLLPSPTQLSLPSTPPPSLPAAPEHNPLEEPIQASAGTNASSHPDLSPPLVDIDETRLAGAQSTVTHSQPVITPTAKAPLPPAPSERPGERHSSRIAEAAAAVTATAIGSNRVLRSTYGSRKKSTSKATPSIKLDVHARCIQVIDLTKDMEDDDQPEKMALEKETSKMIRGPQAVSLHGPFGEISYTPDFHFQPDLDFFYRITEFSSRINISGEPLFKANPALSTIKILTLDAFHNAKVEDIQEIFRKQHIIVTEASMKPKCNFDQAGLLRLARIDQQISINDLSIPVEEDHTLRLRRGTIQDMLDNAYSPGGKALNALDLPMESGVVPSELLSSDMWAWGQTIGLRFCKKTDRFPNTAMRWGLASTANTYSVWHIDCDGLATVIEVQTGCKLWVLARPRKGEDWSYFSKVDNFFDLDTNATNDDRWDCEAVLLTPGTQLYMRPNTPHCVFTLEPTICHGAHFYAASTIRDSCYGLYHSFISGPIVTNTEHEAESRELLRRFVTYIHSIYTSPRHPDCPQSHTIALSTNEGLGDFLTLFNLMELANVFYSKSYAKGSISQREFFDFVEGRRLCRAILQKYNDQFHLVPQDGGKAMTIFHLQREYLSGQLRALIRYKAQMDDIEVTNNIPLSSFMKRLHQLAKDDDLLLNAVDSKGGRPNDPFSHSFGWPPEFTSKFKLTQTTSLVKVNRTSAVGLTPGDYCYLKQNSIPLSVFGPEATRDETLEDTDMAEGDSDEAGNSEVDTANSNDKRPRKTTGPASSRKRGRFS